MSGKGNRWYPTPSQLKDPVAIERSFRRILDHVYRLQDGQDALAAAKPSGNGSSGASTAASQTGPSTSVMLGLRVAPIDTVNEADGNVLTYVKGDGNLQFKPGGTGPAGPPGPTGPTGATGPPGPPGTSPTPHRDVFTPNGVLTAFTLSTTPSGGIVILEWNGLVQDPSNFTVVTTTLTTTGFVANTGESLVAYYWT